MFSVSSLTYSNSLNSVCEWLLQRITVSFLCGLVDFCLHGYRQYPISGGHFASTSYTNKGNKSAEESVRVCDDLFTRSQCLAHRQTVTVCYVNREKNSPTDGN